MVKASARRAAYQIIGEVLNEKAYYNLALKKHLPDVFNAEDKRFATVLSAATLENIAGIDYYLNPFITAKRVHKNILNILRMGACQMMYLHVPESAAVNESVKLTKEIGKQALAGFVNAVLRKFAKEYQSIDLPRDTAQRIHVQYGFPPWMSQKFISQWGKEEAERFFAYTPDYQLTCLRMNTLKTDKEAFEAILKRDGLQYHRGEYIKDAYYVRNITAFEQTEMYTSGKAAAMGESSMIAVAAACSRIKEGARVLDACSAPGGKAACAAALKNNTLEITAWDIHAHRTALIKKNFQRLGVEHACIELKDASVYDESDTQKFDLVIIDAPCSALGLIHKKPDIRIQRQPEDIPALCEMQAKLLQTCSRYVKKGGILAYFTCTLLKEENEDQIEKFLKNNEDFRHADDYELPQPLKARRELGMLTIKPHEDHLDGFFIALLERTT